MDPYSSNINNYYYYEVLNQLSSSSDVTRSTLFDEEIEPDLYSASSASLQISRKGKEKEDLPIESEEFVQDAGSVYDPYQIDEEEEAKSYHSNMFNEEGEGKEAADIEIASQNPSAPPTSPLCNVMVYKYTDSFLCLNIAASEIFRDPYDPNNHLLAKGFVVANFDDGSVKICPLAVIIITCSNRIPVREFVSLDNVPDLFDKVYRHLTTDNASYYGKGEIVGFLDVASQITNLIESIFTYYYGLKVPDDYRQGFPSIPATAPPPPLPPSLQVPPPLVPATAPSGRWIIKTGSFKNSVLIKFLQTLLLKKKD